jgi:hypothetical protein
MGKEEVFVIEKKVAAAVGDFSSGKARKSRDCLVVQILPGDDE